MPEKFNFRLARQMESLVFIGLWAFIFSGCMQSYEHLIVEKDETGTCEMKLTLPAGTLRMVDSLMGGMVKSLTQSKEDSPPQNTESLADQMFGNKERIMEQAKHSGVNIEFLEFHKEKKEDGLYVDYKIKFDDVRKFVEAGIITTKLSLTKNLDGQWICELKQSQAKAEESKLQVEQFQSFQESEEFKNMDPVTKTLITNAMKDFKVEFLLTMPYEIKEINGVFEKKDNHTVRLSLSGDLLENPVLLDTLYGVTDLATRVVWDTRESAPETMTVGQLTGAMVKVYLKNGFKVEGQCLEQTDDYIKIQASGVPVTYYQDEVQTMESF